MNAARVAQGLNAAIVGNHVAELNDFRNATEMLDKTGCSAKGLTSEIVDRNLPVVQIGIRDSAQILIDEILDHAQILADGRRADLLMVADNEYRLAQVQGDQGHDVTLAGFVDDDDVETSHAGIKILHDP